MSSRRAQASTGTVAAAGVPSPEDSPNYDPFDECSTLLHQLSRALTSDAFTKDQRKGVLAPAVRLLRELNRKADALREEHEQAIEIETLKRAVFSLCAVLGIPSAQFFAGLSEMNFKETVSHLRTKIIGLQRTELERRQKVSEIIDTINALRSELGEPPVFRLGATVPALGTINISADTIDIAPQPLSKIEDLSVDAIEAWSTKLKETRKLRENRVKLVKQLSQDILQLWKEDSQLPNSLDPSLPDIDRRILAFSRAQFTSAQTHIGLNSAALDLLVQRKQDLVITKQDRIRTTMEITKRLRLIEDRQVLLNMMARVEAQSTNPLRLFGDSTRLLLEEKFRRIAYPRLLLIEATLRPALVLYRERHRAPFRYKGIDFLEALDEELKTRVVPRGVFPGSATEMKLDTTNNVSDLELQFGMAGDDGNHYKGLSDALASLVSRTQADFARVLALSAKVSDVMAERIMQKSEEDLNWMKGALMSGGEQSLKSEELRLLELGWQLPTTNSSPAIRGAATAGLSRVVATAEKKRATLHQRRHDNPVAAVAAAKAKEKEQFYRGLDRSTTEGQRGKDDRNAPLLHGLDIVGNDTGGRDSPKRSSPLRQADGLIPRMPPRPRRDAAQSRAGPSGYDQSAVYGTAVNIHATMEDMNATSSPRSGYMAQSIPPAKLRPVPPLVQVEPAQCTASHHGTSAPCPEKIHVDNQRFGGQSLPTSNFSEPAGPRLLDAAVLVPQCLPPSDVKHLKIAPTQVQNIRATKHVRLSEMPAFIAEKARQDAAYRRKPAAPFAAQPPASASVSPRGGAKRDGLPRGKKQRHGARPPSGADQPRDAPLVDLTVITPSESNAGTEDDDDDADADAEPTAARASHRAARIVE